MFVVALTVFVVALCVFVCSSVCVCCMLSVFLLYAQCLSATAPPVAGGERQSSHQLPSACPAGCPWWGIGLHTGQRDEQCCKAEE